MNNLQYAQRKKVHFLLVEDDESHAEIIKRGLNRARVNNTLDWVQDGQMAMDFLKKRNGFESRSEPDLVILDLKLPKKNGHEVLSEIRADPSLETIPVVILSTSGAESDRTLSYKLRTNSYLVKPLDYDCFKKLIDDLSFYWGTWNAPPKDTKA
ncbi:MAG: response regulator [Bdellovibrionaceae bacterium]|nr:response regulator [Pseudobdellovibrionaceae bacterium]